ncbi:hypothetical protein FQA39_LY06746 [Lamprigera yunnana]|nr:hypothetical protein FQA39_LY06746 [Lamprigera yunnana]
MIVNHNNKNYYDKRADRTSVTDKANARINIKKDFNSTSPNNIFRRAESLRKFYENKKKEVRKQQAELHQNIIKTGGGPPTKIEINTTDEILLSIMNQETVSGLPFFVDSDSDGNLPVPQYEDIILEVNEYDGIADGLVILTQENNYELVTTSSDYPTWKKYTPANLQDPVRPSLRSATVNIESNDEGVNNITPKIVIEQNNSKRASLYCLQWLAHEENFESRQRPSRCNRFLLLEIRSHFSGNKVYAILDEST